MKKISLFLFIFCLFFCLALSVFAVESYIVHYPLIDSSWNGDFSIFAIDSFPSLGNYHYSVTINYFNHESSFSGTCSAFDFYDGRAVVIPLSLIDQNYNFNILCVWAFDPDLLASYGFKDPSFLVLNADNMDVNLLIGGSVFEFTKIESAGFVDSVNSGLSAVMNWIQSFTVAFSSGQLFPLLTVFILGICIAAFFFAIRYIYKSCWGC